MTIALIGCARTYVRASGEQNAQCQVVKAMTDEELAAFLGILKHEKWRFVIDKLDPKQRAAYERMAEVAKELESGKVPPGVIVFGPRK